MTRLSGDVGCRRRLSDGLLNSHHTTPLLVQGITCWRTVRARHLSLIQDAGPYFAALASTLESARRTIFILGWDIDSRTPLRPGDTPGKGGAALLPLLLGCLSRQPSLRIFVLIWDFSFIYAFEREPRPRQQFGRVHPRLHFALDAEHGNGGSHHQKIVVVDDEVAFVGGIDLTTHRWDMPAHPLHDPRRVDADGGAYEPFHDVHAAVAGPAAAALGELARARWQAGRHRARTPPLDPSQIVSAWPRELAVDASDIEVALARTLVSAEPPPVKEIAELTARMIASATRFIYAENQYLTSGAIVRALALRLAEPDGPEIALVLPAVESGWMEKSSMGVLRDGALAHLRRQDLHGRLRLVSPVVSNGAEARQVSVHAKVLVVDDRIAKIGSANFSNRSLGLDSECDLAVEANDGSGAAFVASVRNRLLGEHLGLSEGEVGKRLAAGATLGRLIDGQPRSAPRSLVSVPIASGASFDFTVLDGAVVDPTEPWSADGLLERAVPVPLRRRLARRWLRPMAFAAAVVGAWAALRHGSLSTVHLGAGAREVAGWLAGRPAGPILAFLAVTVAGCCFVPITLLATATLTVFGVWPGVVIAWAGAVASATLSHAIGLKWGRGALDWLPLRLVATVRRFLGRRPFWAVVLMRLLPVGNFGALNVLAGALKIPRRSFVFGNLVGLLPGMLGLGVLVNRALAALRRPSAGNVVSAVMVALVVSGLGIVAKRRFASPATSSTRNRAGKNAASSVTNSGANGAREAEP